MFQNRDWRRRLQALLGRGMADDGPCTGLAHARDSPGTPGHDRDSPMHRIRLRHDGHHARRAFVCTMHDGHHARREIERIRPCPAPAVGIAGYPVLRYPSLTIGTRLSGDCCTGCERPNAGPQARRWQTCRSVPTDGTRRPS